MKAKELKKWREMKSMGKKKFIIADGILMTGLLTGILLSYILKVFLFSGRFFLVALVVIPLMSLFGIYTAKTKWEHMQKREAFDLKQDKNPGSNPESFEKDDLSFLDDPEEIKKSDIEEE